MFSCSEPSGEARHRVAEGLLAGLEAGQLLLPVAFADLADGRPVGFLGGGFAAEVRPYRVVDHPQVVDDLANVVATGHRPPRSGGGVEPFEGFIHRRSVPGAALVGLLELGNELRDVAHRMPLFLSFGAGGSCTASA